MRRYGRPGTTTASPAGQAAMLGTKLQQTLEDPIGPVMQQFWPRQGLGPASPSTPASPRTMKKALADAIRERGGSTLFSVGACIGNLHGTKRPLEVSGGRKSVSPKSQHEVPGPMDRGQTG